MTPRPRKPIEARSANSLSGSYPRHWFRERWVVGLGVALIVASALVWFRRNLNDGMGQSGEGAFDGIYFSEDYRTARGRFRRAIREAGGGLETLPLSVQGPDGDDLSIDIGWFGAQSPSRVLLHVSGTHGVEAFAGSAIQLRLIDQLPAIPEGAAVVFIHVLNPYGMAWLRRTNENNVDLNRNFLPVGTPYTGHPDGYEALYDFLNPSQLPLLDLFVLRAGLAVIQHGRSALEAAVVTGQYDYPQGLFFGGNERQQGVRRYADFLARRLSGARAVFAIDVHTGLGPFGEDTVLVSESQYGRLRPLLGDRVEAFSTESANVAYVIRGGHHEGIVRLLDAAHVDFVGQEFGTYSQIRVLAALRKENYAHHHTEVRVDSPSKAALKEAFNPGDASWRRRVLTRGEELFAQGLSILSDL